MEAEPLSELAHVVVWRLIDAIEKHGEKIQTETQTQTISTFLGKCMCLSLHCLNILFQFHYDSQH